jgi:large subunit ribosomal protein L25
MASHDLNVQTREQSGKESAKKLRREGKVPAVIYGRQEEPIRLAINAKELRDMLAHHGSHGLLSLKDEGGSATPALIKALQKHPVKHHILSVDFLRVSLSEKVRATVPVILDGEPVGVKVDGGILVHAMHEIEIEALPQDLPEAIHADVSELQFDGAPLYVKDLTLPSGVTVITDGDEDIAVVNPPQREAETTEEVSADEVPAAHGDTATAEDAGQA